MKQSLKVTVLSLCATLAFPLVHLEAGALAIKKAAKVDLGKKVAPAKVAPAPAKAAPAPVKVVATPKASVSVQPAPKVNPQVRAKVGASIVRRMRRRHLEKIDGKQAAKRAESSAAKAAEQKVHEARTHLKVSAHRIDEARGKISRGRDAKRVQSLLKRLGR